MPGFDLTLRRLTIRDDRFLREVQGSQEANRAVSGLDAKTDALVRIAALASLDASPQSYGPCVEDARHGGASDEEIVGALIAAIPVVGAPRVVSAAPKLALALGYDLEAALEEDGDALGVRPS